MAAGPDELRVASHGDLADHGPHTARRLAGYYLSASGKKPLRRQAREVVQLARAHRFLPYQYLTYGLFLESAPGDAVDFVPPRLLNRHRDRLNQEGDPRLTKDKAECSRLLLAAGVPAIECLFTIAPSGEVTDGDGRPVSVAEVHAALAAAGHDEVFVKPLDLSYGLGSARARVADGFFVVGPDRFTPAALVERLSPGRRTSRYVVQPNIRQHPTMAELNPGSVNTVRIDTMATPTGIAHNGAYLRVGDGTKFVDNVIAGGYMVPVDLDTGALRCPAYQYHGMQRDEVDRHARTGIRFDTVTLPHWDAVKAVARRALPELTPLGHVGWDIAITPDGPVIVEANQRFDITALQFACGGLAGAPVGRAISAARGRR